MSSRSLAPHGNGRLACASDGLLALDPVRCEDGKVRSRHVAQASGLRWQPAPALAAEARAALEEAFVPSAAETRLVRRLKRRCVEWEVLLPADGIAHVALNFANFCDKYF